MAVELWFQVQFNKQYSIKMAREKSKDIIMYQVLDQIIDNSTNDWKDIANLIGVTNEEINKMVSKYPDNEFEQAYHSIHIKFDHKKETNWDMLKQALVTLQKYQLIYDVEKHNLLLPVVNTNGAENCQHSLCLSDFGFGIICHYSDAEIDLMNNLLELDSFTSKKRIRLYRGACGTDQIPISQWQKECQQYFERFYKNSKVSIIQHNQEIDKTQGLMKYVNENKPGCIIQGYNIIEHFQFLDQQHLLKQISQQSRIDFNKFTLAYESTNNAFYFFIYSKSVTLNELYCDIKKCSMYIRLFSVLHKDTIINSGTVLIGMIILEKGFRNLIDQAKKICDQCSIYILSLPEFMYFDKNYHQISKEIRQNIIKKKTKVNFNWSNCINQIIGFMATVSTISMPNFSIDTSEQIDQVSMILTPQQIEIINSSDKHTIIKGPHGSGKSIIGRVLLEKLAKESKKNIYYIDFNKGDLFLAEMKKTVQYLNIKYKQNICCFSRWEKSEKNASLIDTLNLLCEKHDGEEIHVIFEEVCLEEINYQLFNQTLQRMQLKNSTVVIIAHSLTKRRNFIIKSSEHPCPIQRDHRNLHLETNPEIKIHTLTNSARTTLSIDKVLNVARSILSNCRNLFSGFGTYSADIERKESDMPSQFIEDSYEDNDLDEIIKFNDSNRDEIERDTNYTLESRFEYLKVSSSIHNITGPKPVVMYPFGDNEPAHDFDSAYKLMLCFKYILSKNLVNGDKESYVLHFEMTPCVVTKALTLFELVTNSKTNKCSFNLQPFAAVRGMEFENVIVYIDRNEYHLRHYLIEAMSRSKCNLVILVSGQQRQLLSTVDKIVDTCKKNCLINIMTNRQENNNVEKKYLEDTFGGEITEINSIKEY